MKEINGKMTDLFYGIEYKHKIENMVKKIEIFIEKNKGYIEKI